LPVGNLFDSESMSKPLTVVNIFFNYLIVMQTPFRTDIQYVKHMVMICDFD